MRIDAHHHVWDLRRIHYPWLMAKGVRRFFGDPTPIQRNYSVDEFRREAEQCGFEASVHIEVGAGDPLAEAEWVNRQSVKSGGWPTVQVAHCDLVREDAETVLNALVDIPTVRGVRHIIGRSEEEDARTGSNDLLTSRKFAGSLRLLADMGFSFDLQLTPGLIPRTADLLAGLPSLRVALCHAGSPNRRRDATIKAWEANLPRLAALPQLSCKLSGLGMFHHGWTVDEIRPIVETCLDVFGPARCMFGSNFPVDSLQSTYRDAVRAYEEIIPATMHDAVFGGNAAEFYRFPVRKRT
ncbi:MAG: amidohydrolase family protein [Rhodobacteraceae bacterium]|nr:amidohydrolase family protein [Paracoccaceae bacterium]